MQTICVKIVAIDSLYSLILFCVFKIFCFQIVAYIDCISLNFVSQFRVKKWKLVNRNIFSKIQIRFHFHTLRITNYMIILLSIMSNVFISIQTATSMGYDVDVQRNKNREFLDSTIV